MHEIAHALAHRDSLVDGLPAYSDFGDEAEEFLADRLVCQWGLFEGLRAERISSYGICRSGRESRSGYRAILQGKVWLSATGKTGRRVRAFWANTLLSN